MDDLISVVILNWNGSGYIRQCLDSVLNQAYKSIEILVVDNASDDNSPEIVEKEYKNVILIRNDKNLGYGGGNNIGIKRSKGKFVLVLNNDAELDRQCISEMRRAIDRDVKYGAAASKILFKDSPGVLDAAGIVVFPDGLSIGRGRLEAEGCCSLETEVFFASGCCALYRRAMLEDIKVGDEYYDEDFFAYADDTDLGWRAQLRGWKCIYTPNALVYHAHSASSGNYSPLKAFLVERNRMWLEVKNFPLSLIMNGYYYTFLRYFYQAYGAFSGKGAAGAFSEEYSKWQLITILLRSYIVAITGLPKMLRKRKQIQARKITKKGDILDLMRAYGIDARSIAFTK